MGCLCEDMRVTDDRSSMEWIRAKLWKKHFV